MRLYLLMICFPAFFFTVFFFFDPLFPRLRTGLSADEGRLMDDGASKLDAPNSLVIRRSLYAFAACEACAHVEFLSVRDFSLMMEVTLLLGRPRNKLNMSIAL